MPGRDSWAGRDRAALRVGYSHRFSGARGWTPARPAAYRSGETPKEAGQDARRDEEGRIAVWRISAKLSRKPCDSAVQLAPNVPMRDKPSGAVYVITQNLTSRLESSSSQRNSRNQISSRISSRVENSRSSRKNSRMIWSRRSVGIDGRMSQQVERTCDYRSRVQIAGTRTDKPTPGSRRLIGDAGGRDGKGDGGGSWRSGEKAPSRCRWIS